MLTPRRKQWNVNRISSFYIWTNSWYLLQLNANNITNFYVIFFFFSFREVVQIQNTSNRKKLFFSQKHLRINTLLSNRHLWANFTARFGYHYDRLTKCSSKICFFYKNCTIATLRSVIRNYIRREVLFFNLTEKRMIFKSIFDRQS